MGPALVQRSGAAAAIQQKGAGVHQKGCAAQVQRPAARRVLRSAVQPVIVLGQLRWLTWGVIGIQYRRVPCTYQPNHQTATIQNPTPGEKPPSWGKLLGAGEGGGVERLPRDHGAKGIGMRAWPTGTAASVRRLLASSASRSARHRHHRPHRAS
ncbi:hypothetical protein TSOC_001502 [Tetrabaena socialis]|uniref:Uncharacterized protein n=1 Tax=Tetrabaena socialis TaxID=47790 RepID=A0A2J8AGL7_9CHLO|nr:hypothetical protein TSOC_001502 [Tetrabaena socialis]|eukprot:PNH11646.1 hypothetical protein TSOC_001502 [Tetrabaena socialis]